MLYIDKYKFILKLYGWGMAPSRRWLQEHHLPGSILARITSKVVSRLGQARPFCRRALSICTVMGEAHSSVHAIKLSLQLRLARRSRRTSLLGLAHRGFLPRFCAVLCRAFALLPLCLQPQPGRKERSLASISPACRITKWKHWSQDV